MRGVQILSLLVEQRLLLWKKNHLGWFQLATAVAAVRRLDFGECSVDMRLRWLLGFDSMLSAIVVEVGPVDIGCVVLLQ